MGPWAKTTVSLGLAYHALQNRQLRFPVRPKMHSFEHMLLALVFSLFVYIWRPNSKRKHYYRGFVLAQQGYMISSRCVETRNITNVFLMRTSSNECLSFELGKCFYFGCIQAWLPKSKRRVPSAMFGVGAIFSPGEEHMQRIASSEVQPKRA